MPVIAAKPIGYLRMRLLILLLVLSMEGMSQMPKKSETVKIDGAEIYYEVFGKGEPLFLLHGFTQSSKSWLPYVADYEKDYEIYLVDLKGHGKSSWFTEKISIRSVAIELNKLISHLKLTHINAIGFSYGGEVLFQLALINPGSIRSMVIIGSCGTWHAREFPEFVDYLSYKNIEDLPWMREQQTNEDQIKSILAQVPNYDVTVTDEELKRIQARTLLVIGDSDEATPIECIANAKKHMPNGFLWVLPNTVHSAHKDEHKSEFVRVSKEFFRNWEK